MRAYRSLGAFACVGKCRSYGAQSAFICVYPGFHIGLCPHSTLGYAGVSPLQGSLSDWAFAVLCRGIVFVVFIPLGHLLAWVSAAPTELNSLLSVFTQGSISGFALISPWALQECRPYRALFILLSAFTQGSISGFALITPWALQECRPCRALCRIGRLRSCVVVLCSLNVFGVCKMDCCVRSCFCLIVIVWVVVRDCLGD